jgi:hypothetical protein
LPQLPFWDISAIGARMRTARSGQGAFGETKYIFDSRLRMEDVDQDPLPRTPRSRCDSAGIRNRQGKWNTALLVEGEAVMPSQDDYRPIRRAGNGYIPGRCR